MLTQTNQSRTQHGEHRHQNLPLPDLAALRAATSTSGFKPAEEQFIEQTPWANPQHPSHAHLIQRQTSGHQTPRTNSPFSASPLARRLSQQQNGSGVPIAGTFLTGPAGRISPHNHNNPFMNPSHTHNKVVPSPLASRQHSVSPKQTEAPRPSHPRSTNKVAQSVEAKYETSTYLGLPEWSKQDPR
jgi:hypothetical protein